MPCGRAQLGLWLPRSRHHGRPGVDVDDPYSIEDWLETCYLEALWRSQEAKTLK